MASTTAGPKGSSIYTITLVITTITVLLNNEGAQRYRGQGPEILPLVIPPQRTQATRQAGDDLRQSQQELAAAQPDLGEDDIQAARDNIKLLKSIYDMHKDDDRFNIDEYNLIKKQRTDYTALCSSIVGILKEHLSDVQIRQLFPPGKLTLGLNPQSELQIHELIVALDTAKASVQRISVPNAYQLIGSVIASVPKNGMHQGSGVDFMRLFTDLHDLYEELRASAEADPAGAQPLILTTAHIRLVCMDILNLEPFTTYRDVLAIAWPAAVGEQTKEALHTWFIAASAKVTTDAGNSKIPVPKVAAAATFVPETPTFVKDKRPLLDPATAAKAIELFRDYKMPLPGAVAVAGSCPYHPDLVHHGAHCYVGHKLVNDDTQTKQIASLPKDLKTAWAAVIIPSGGFRRRK